MSRNFNGSSNYIDIESNTVPKPPMTIFAWIKIASFATGQKVVARWDDGPPSTHFLLQTNTDSTLGFVVKNSNNTARWGRKSMSLSTDTWYAIAAVSDNISVSGVKVYIDGVPYSNAWIDDNSGTNDISAQLTLGAGQSDAARVGHFNGILAEVAIWDVLLTDND